MPPLMAGSLMKADAQSFSPSSNKNHYKHPSSSIMVGSETKDSPSLIFSKNKAFDSSQKCKVFTIPILFAFSITTSNSRETLGILKSRE